MKVVELPKTLKLLGHLAHLNVSMTPLGEIPAWLGEMENLHSISAGKMWHFKRLPKFEGKIVRSYISSISPDDRVWLDSIGAPQWT